MNKNDIIIPDYLGEIELNDKLCEAYDLIVNQNENVLITGSGGVGKSVFVEILKADKKTCTIFLAPTGVAAVRIGGQTVHSFFNFPPYLIKNENLRINAEKREMMQDIERIVIDEIFMCRADIIDGMDNLLKRYRFSDEPFGGVQMVFVGDLYQLPPIVNKDSDEGEYLFSEYSGFPYFFKAFTYKYTDRVFKHIEFTKIYRQANQDFVETLNRVRKGLHTPRDMAILNRRILPEEVIANKEKKYVYLSPFNKTVDAINSKFLNKIEEPLHYFPAVGCQKEDGTFPAKDELQKAFNTYFNTPYLLILKKGAKVMFTQNNMPTWINGTIGFVVDFTEQSSIIVDINGEQVEVLPYNFKKQEYRYAKKVDKVKKLSTNSNNLIDFDELLDEKTKDNEKDNSKKLELHTIISSKQFPLKLAYAVSIHKSQSATFDAGYIDLGNYVFAEGMTYVALSRFRDLNKIGLKRGIKDTDIKVNVDAAVFLKDADVIEKYQVKSAVNL